MNIISQKILQSLFVGIDISKEFFEICYLNTAGKVLNTFQIYPDRKGFEELINMLPGDIHPVFAMESSGPLAGNLTQYLKENKFEMIVSNPFEVSRLRAAFSSSVKNDLIDAFVIAQAARMGILKNSQKDDEYVFLQDLLERYHDIKDRQTALINQLRSNLVQTFPEMEKIFTNIQCNASLAILSKYQTPVDLLQSNKQEIKKIVQKENGKIKFEKLDQLFLLCNDSVAWKTKNVHKLIVQSQVRELNVLKEEIKFLKTALNDLVRISFDREIELLKSVPGISDFTSFQALAVIGNHLRFDPKRDGGGSKRLSGYVGFGVREYNSGYRKIKTGISKRGNSRLRGFLFMAAMAAIRVDADLKLKYEEAKRNKGNGKKALVAISHLLLRRCYGVLRSGKLYNPAIPKAGATA